MYNKLQFAILNNATILPWRYSLGKGGGGGIISELGEPQPSSTWYEGYPIGYDYSEIEVEYRDETVIFIGSLFHIWGHAITDNLKKAWYLYENQPKHKLVYVTIEDKPLPEYVFELFERSGVNIRNAERITKPTRFREIINPHNSLIRVNKQRLFTKEFSDTISRITYNIPQKDIGKVYFTRTHLKQLDSTDTSKRQYRDTGEITIERQFEKRGYSIIAPEEYSIIEQLTILQNCTSFVSTEGSISHSSIFCKPGTEVILLKKIDFINPYTEVINEMKQLNVKYINVHRSSITHKEKPWLGPFFLYITSDLSRHFGWHGIHIPHILLPSWYEYRFNLWSRLHNSYYGLRAKLGIMTRISRLLKNN